MFIEFHHRAVNVTLKRSRFAHYSTEPARVRGEAASRCMLAICRARRDLPPRTPRHFSLTEREGLQRISALRGGPNFAPRIFGFPGNAEIPLTFNMSFGAIVLL